MWQLYQRNTLILRPYRVWNWWLIDYSHCNCHRAWASNHHRISITRPGDATAVRRRGRAAFKVHITPLKLSAEREDDANCDGFMVLFSHKEEFLFIRAAVHTFLFLFRDGISLKCIFALIRGTFKWWLQKQCFIATDEIHGYWIYASKLHMQVNKLLLRVSQNEVKLKMKLRTVTFFHSFVFVCDFLSVRNKKKQFQWSKIHQTELHICSRIWTRGENQISLL